MRKGMGEGDNGYLQYFQACLLHTMVFVSQGVHTLFVQFQ